MIPISWITNYEIQEEDSLSILQLENQKGRSPSDPLCTARFRIFSPNSIYTFAAQTNAETKKWVTAISLSLNILTSDPERKDKEEASKVFFFLFSFKSNLYL